MSYRKRFFLNALAAFVIIIFGTGSKISASEICDHEWEEDYTYQICDDTYHYVGERCYDCWVQRYQIKEMHDWFEDYDTEYVDSDYHKRLYTCNDCGATKFIKEKHDWSDGYDTEYVDSAYHKRLYTCNDCGATKFIKEKHDWSDGYATEYTDSTYHKKQYTCNDCNAQIWRKEKHSLVSYDSYVSKSATLYSKGTIRYNCEECGTYIPRTIKWKYDGEGCSSYDFQHSTIYKNSKCVYITLDSPIKNAVLKVKIGKKTYTTKIKKQTKKVKVKIRRPAYGSKINIVLTYKGKVVGKDKEPKDVVWYASHVKNNMTKNQVKYTWGTPERTSSSSGGWNFWYYGDGSYVGFKKGKVKYWYDAAK